MTENHLSAPSRAAKRPPASADPAPELPADQRIIHAAYECFERFGIAKTNIEDIAKHSGLSRQTIYRYFSGKDDIIEHICMIEAVRVNSEVRQKLGKFDTFEAILVETLFLIIRIVSANMYLRSLLENVAAQSMVAQKESRIHQINREMWAPLLERAAVSGELAADLNIDDVLSWLFLTQAALQVRISGGEVADQDLRHVIRRFVVRPLLGR